jgi:exonuclease 3'-5' domain-containing protein 1
VRGSYVIRLGYLDSHQAFGNFSLANILVTLQNSRMSTESPRSVTVFISSTTSLILLLDSLVNLPVDPPSLYFDLEGARLGRLGSLSLLVLYVAPQRTTYIIDVHSLGADTFTTENSDGNSLRAVLQSPTLPKVFFDIRNDSDALYSHYNISVNAIIDIQLLELATRDHSMAYVAGLAKCIKRDSTASAAVKLSWQRTKETVSRLYDPYKGGNFDVFNERPLKPEILRYCNQDVELLPSLWQVYSSKLRLPDMACWRQMVREAAKERIQLSQSKNYDGQAKSKVYGPWDPINIEESIENWNHDVMIWSVKAHMVLDEDDHWVYSSQEGARRSSVFTLVAVK